MDLSSPASFSQGDHSRVTGFGVRVQGRALQQSAWGQPGEGVWRRRVGGRSQLPPSPECPCLGSQAARSGPEPERCVPSCRSGSWGSGSEPAGRCHCNPCPSRQVGGMVGSWKGAQRRSVRSRAVLGCARVEGVAGSSRDYTWSFAFIATEWFPS